MNVTPSLGKTVTDDSDAARPVSLSSLGWSHFFEDQLEPHEAGLTPHRIATVHRARLTAISQSGPGRADASGSQPDRRFCRGGLGACRPCKPNCCIAG